MEPKKIKRGKLKEADFYTPDGRIDADVAFGYVIEQLQQMTPEEFRAIDEAPMTAYFRPAPTATKPDAPKRVQCQAEPQEAQSGKNCSCGESDRQSLNCRGIHQGGTGQDPFQAQEDRRLID